MQCHNSFFSKINAGKNTVLIEVPHGGDGIPEFMKPYIRDKESVEQDKDWFTQEVYGSLQNEVHAYIQWNNARVLADPNRNLADHLEVIERDGVIKKCSMFSREVWTTQPPLSELNSFIDTCIRPYYKKLEELISLPKIEYVIFGHSMPETKTVSTTAKDTKNTRPLISISNGNNHPNGMSEEKIMAITKTIESNIYKFNLSKINYDTEMKVGINYPYAGEVSINRFSSDVYGNTKALLIEFNRGLGKNEENIEILKNIMKEITLLLSQ